ncbi:MAG: hypothetical protein PHV34_11450 [Verrucomicrobiae bacterium]|nr:hypothetical protein [Verrucomicrobiae bacterium]
MNWEINPFQELYLSDSVNEEAFVELFSPVPLTSAINPLFQEGNVVLLGTQGCGKSMILRLLFPETRIAYANKKVPFPVDIRSSRFVSAGVNLIKSGICDIGQVSLGNGDDFDVEHLAYFFADFFNGLVVQDLLKTLVIINDHSDIFDGIVNAANGAKFAESLVPQDCWLGLLDGCRSLNDIQEKLSERIKTYRQWISNPDIGLPKKLATTKTTIGEPIARTVECLKRSGVLQADVKVFVRVDQLEELHQEAGEHQRRIRARFRQMLNRAFASRDLRLHYRIGTRRYGWNQPEHLIVHGSGARLEVRRDYLPVDLEDTLTRKERRKGWTFPSFAANAFRRRVQWALQPEEKPNDRLFAGIFGKQPTPAERAAKFAGNTRAPDQIDRILRLVESENWSADWKNWLGQLAAKSSLDAVLAAAWGRQTGGGNRKTANREKPPPSDDRWMKRWWKKERLMQGVLQLAARRAQRLLWWGSKDLISLSAPNITVFLHLCHAVWDLFLKEQRLIEPASKRRDLLDGASIPEDTQAAGIQNASREWHEKLGEQPGGDVRRRFIDELGRKFREQLRDDLPMSYPGANGFSLRRDELELSQNRDLLRFLTEAVGCGDLVATEHTTKSQRGERRVKFYLNPVLSPIFQIPAAHTKEPLYWSVLDVMQVAKAAQLPFAVNPRSCVGEGADLEKTESLADMVQRDEDPNQLKLF